MSAPDRPRTALISGGSRGLGLAVAERLLAEGTRVATFSRSSTPALEELRDKYPDELWWSPADLRDTGELHRVVARAAEHFGGLDILVNNGGLLHQELLLTHATARVEELVAVNLVAPMVLAQAAARVMSRTGGGAIVNVSSINAIRGFRGVSVYAGAKAGLDGFGRSLARELGPLGIRVNSVVPGFFDTDMTAAVSAQNRERITRRTPLGRLASVAEIAEVVLFLCSAPSSFITGQTLVVDGGITC
ncbi:SDR family NAD(P)-dependent oxidoreductase [Actinoplanes sp. L3-i22]|uniref:SDR family NAD(P)-dependent oxidoreductase n=1 Tax=Actinoplanes sp. L3-i22 TaxID=2836373 RepID=UPI001C74CC52|nr:SDR family oxidoreductase [Actinoplanes sp. L3-i22]BCY08845.1 beta-ketoacyl-ACP reductase [Actinoplanes sp. L3-i22]